MSEILNNPQAMKQRDQQGMSAILESFDQQLEEALKIGLQAEIPALSDVRNIIVCGMGGSAIGGDFLRAYLGADLKVPLYVNRHYSIPGFADPSTLALICSYSGNTEETLSAFQEARSLGCSIICWSSNGQLQSLAEQYGFPCVTVPGGLPPRCALGYSTIPLLVVFARLGLISDRSKEMQSSLEWVRSRIEVYRLESPVEQNEAKKLASQVHGKIPVIYGSQNRLEVIATRWRGQFCENGKQLAYSSTLPEMNHNEIVGWEHPSEVLHRLIPIFLRDSDDHPRLQIRTDVTQQILSRKSAAVLEYWSQGESWMDRLWSLILLGDYASLYLAFLNDENPVSVEIIEDLKTRLSRHPEQGEQSGNTDQSRNLSRV
ncbi:bifunctional phosphoglucose/phosphomannose isomerase [Acidobacteria bacterium AH-259-D05]|nr:bifunctional phosphoglucose/phosphomannose isomerase [Acidobacteria bacterium AH-259-D05]